MAGEIKNVKSANHKVNLELDSSDTSRGILSLDDRERKGLNGKDFVISIEDSLIHAPTAIVHQN